MFVEANCQNIYNQQTKVLKSAITSVGSYSAARVNSNIIMVQSVGQSSIVGTKKVGSTVVQQGYLNHVIGVTIKNTDRTIIKEKIDLVVYPNPFIDYIKIVFSEKTKYNVNVQIYDITGRFLFAKEFEPTDLIMLPMNNYSEATYTLLVTSGYETISKKIIKSN